MLEIWRLGEELAKPMLDGVEDQRHFEKQHGDYPRSASDSLNVISPCPAGAGYPMHASVATVFIAQADHVDVADWAYVPLMVRMPLH